MSKSRSRTLRPKTVLSTHYSRRRLYLAILAASQIAATSMAEAGPTGGTVVGGTGSIDQSELNTTVRQQTDRLAINWDSFNLDANESVTFIQPDASAIALNRILGNSGSEIHGRINANGHVVLVNPHGVFFGENATVNVGGLIASGLDINPDAFMNGSLNFAALDGSEGKVINSGIIEASTGGSVTLLGQQVKNGGLIMANLGAVNLAAGKEAVVTFDSAGLMGVKVTKEILQDELGLDAAVLNEGDIQAAGGRILLTASTSQDIFSQAINTGELGEAKSVVVHEDGSFTLGAGADVVNTGRLDVSAAEGDAGTIVALGENVTSSGEILADTENGGAGSIELHASHTTLLTGNSLTSARAERTSTGGEVKVLGHHVGLFDSATVDVSGALGGGEVYIGGDYQGKNPYLRNAWRTFVAEETAIYADALGQGDGGRVIVWADDITRFHGDIYARGAGGGNGGFAEVSGKNFLSFNGYADLSGPGLSGVLLLDPENIIVGLSGAASGSIGFGDPGDNGGNTATISSSTIQTLLETSNVELQATDNISIDREINASANLGEDAKSLTLEAGNGITISANVGLGDGDMIFTAGHNGCGGVECQGTDGTRDFTLNGSASLNTAGQIKIHAADDILINGSVGGISQPNAITLRAGNTITTNKAITAGIDAPIILSAGDTALYAAPVDHDNDSTTPNVPPTGTPTGNLTISGAMETSGGTVWLNTIGAVEVHANILTGGGDFLVGVDADTTDGIAPLVPTSFANYFDDGTGGTLNTGTTLGAGDVVINTAVNGADTGHVTLGHVGLSYDWGQVDTNGGAVSTGSITVTAGGNFTLSEDFNFNDSGPRTGGGDFLADVDGNATVSEVFLDVTAGGNITLNGAISDSYGDERDALNIDLTANNGTITFNSDIYTAGGNFTASAPTITSTSGTEINTNLAHGDSAGNPQNAGWSNGGTISLSAANALTARTMTTNGGGITLSGAGDIDILGNVATSGGNFTVGSEQNRVASFDSSMVTISTAADTGGGDITLYTTNDASLGSATFGGATKDDGNVNASIGDVTVHSSAGNITLANSYAFYSYLAENTEGLTEDTDYIGNMNLTAAAGTINLNGVTMDNGAYMTPTGRLNLDLDAGNGITINAASDASIWLDGGAVTATTTNGNITVSGGGGGGVLSTEGGNVSLTANAGNVFINGQGVRTGGGAFSVNSATEITLDTDASPSLATAGGNVSLNASSAININDQVHTGGGDFATTGTGSFTNTASIDTNSGDVWLNNAGATEVKANIATNGGNFNVGVDVDSEDGLDPVLPASFANWFSDGSGGTINTSNSSGAGNIFIAAAGNVDLGTLDIGGNSDVNLLNRIVQVDVVSGGNATLHSDLDFDDTGYSGDQQAGLAITAQGDVTVGADIFDSGGGNVDAFNVTLAADSDNNDTGTVSLAGDVYTAGGNFTASGYSFDSGVGVINTDWANSGETSGRSNGGNVSLSTFSSIVLGNITSDATCDAGCNGNFDINAPANASVTQAAGTELSIAGNTQITAGSGSVTLANTGNTFNGNVAFTGAGNVSLVDSDSNGIALGTSSITGTLNLSANGDITDEGVISVSGQTTVSTNGNALHWGDYSHDFNGFADLTNVSDVAITDANDLTVGNITTTGGQDADGNGIRLTAGTDLTSGDLTTTGAEDQDGGTIVLTATSGSLTTGALTTDGGESSGYIDGTPGLNAGNVTLNAIGDVNVAAAIRAVGSDGDDGHNSGTNDQWDGGQGGNVTITSTGTGTVTVSAITTDGGSGHAQHDDAVDDADGGDAGSVSIEIGTGGLIQLGGNISAKGGYLYEGSNVLDRENGAGGTVTLTGPVQLTASSVTIDTTLVPNNLNSNAVGPAHPGSVTFLGAIDALNPGGANLTINANNVTFNGALGGNNRLGALSVTAAGTVDATDVNITATSVNATAATFTSGDINTAGLADMAGGSISIDAEGAVTLGAVNTQGGAITSSGAGAAGGAVTISGSDITLVSINTSGSDAAGVFAGGNAGAISVTATDTANGTPSIQLNGNVTSEGGNGDTVGTGAVGEFILAGDESATGSVFLNHTQFFTSSFDIIGSGGNDRISGVDVNSTWAVNGENSGTLSSTAGDGGIVSFTGVESLAGGSGDDHFIFSSNGSIASIDGGADGADLIYGLDTSSTWTLSDAANSVQHSADNTYYINTFSNIEALQGGSAEDVFNVSRDFGGAVRGGLGNDRFNLLSGGQLSHVEGEGGTDTLAGRDQANSWVLLSQGEGTLSSSESPAYSLTFGGIESLEGGDASDAFDIGASFTTITGGAGNDTFELTAGGVTGQIDGGGESGDTLIGGPAVTNHWIITGANGGYLGLFDATSGTPTSSDVLLFESVANLTGGGLGDIFTVHDGGSISGTIDGADGTNELDLSDVSSSLTVGFGSTPTDWNILNIQTLIGNGDDSTLSMASGHNTWAIGTPNSGTLTTAPSDGGDALFQGQLTFTAFATLNGGTGNDVFAFEGGSVSGAVNGGTGTDTVETSVGVGNNWTLAGSGVGTLNASDFTGIEQLNGAGSDSLTGASQDNLWEITGNGVGTVSLSTNPLSDTMQFSGMSSVVGGTDSDRFEFGSSGVLASLDGGDDGNSASNVIQGRDSASYWTITGINSGSLALQDADGSEGAAYVGTFRRVNTLQGGNRADTFAIGETNGVLLEGSIDGGAGDETDRILMLRNVATTWTVTGAGRGDFEYGYSDGASTQSGTTSFQGIEAVTGSAAKDTFVVEVLEAITLDGGASDNDELDLTGITDQDVEIALGSSAPIDGNLTVNNVSEINASTAPGRTNTLIGYVEGSDWDITGNNQGRVASAGSSGAEILFSGFSRLWGSESAQDVFRFSSNGAIGTIDGRSAVNTLIGHSADSTWSIATENAGSVAFTATGTDYVQSFSNISSLQSGGGNNIFHFEADGAITGAVTGGSGHDAVDITDVTQGMDVRVGLSGDADLHIVGIEQIDADSSSNSQLLAEDITNTWFIDDTNAGTLNGPSLSFSGFSQLTGGSEIDTFTFASSGAVTGRVDGGSGAGKDVLDLTALQRDLSIQIDGGAATSGDIRAQNFEEVDGRNGFTNSFVAAGGNNWSITGSNTGVINSGEIEFQGFANLIGGSGDDKFTFTSAGSLSGYIDGGNHIDGDTVDISQTNGLTVTLGSSGTAWRNIETIIGNNADAVLQATTGDHVWVLDNGANRGSLDGTSFEGFAHLIGGSGSNIFNVNGGWVTGSLTGGSGAGTSNTLNLTVSHDATRALEFNGGASANNVIYVSGGSEQTVVRHNLSGQGDGSLTYTGGNNRRYTLDVSGISSVEDDVSAGSLLVNAEDSNAHISLTSTGYELGDLSVAFENKHDLTVDGDAGDTVSVRGDVTVDGDLTIESAALVAESAAHSLTAGNMFFNNLTGVGSNSQRLVVGADNLSLNQSSGPVYLDALGDLNLASYSSSGVFDLALEGDFTSSTGVLSTQVFRVQSTEGSIDLSHTGNALSGELQLVADDEIRLFNQGATNLAKLSAQSLALESTGVITGTGPVSVAGEAVLSSGGNLRLTNEGNALNIVTVAKADNVDIHNGTSLTLRGITATGNVTTVSSGLNIIGSINAASLEAESGSGAVVISGNIDVDHAVSVQAQGLNINNGIVASSISLDGGEGDISLAASLDTRSGESINIEGRNIQQLGSLLGGGDIDIVAAGDYQQSGNVSTAGDLNLSASGDIIVTGGAETVATNLFYSAGGDVDLQDIAASGTLSVEAAGGAVRQQGTARITEGILVNAGQFVMADSTLLESTNAGVTITARGTSETQTIQAKDDININVDGGLQLSRRLESSAGGLSITAKDSVTSAAELIASGDISVNASSGSVEQSGVIESAGGHVIVSASNGIAMGSSAETSAASGNITYTAGQNLEVSSLRATQGTVKLTSSKGQIAQLSASHVLEANRLELNAHNGVGAGQPLNTRVSELAVSNRTGDAAVANSGQLIIDSFRNNGDINITNAEGDLILNTAIGQPYKHGEADANVAGGTSNANYDLGSVTIFVTDGSIYGTGPANAAMPDVVARDSSILAPLGNIGQPGRPLVLYVKGISFIRGLRSWDPLWGFNSPPQRHENASTIQASLFDLINTASEQMVQVETLEDIDPAVFADVRNFFYNDVSILLPEDQRYEEY